MNSENFREINLDGFNITLWKDHYVPNDQYTEEQWRNGTISSMAKIHDAYITIESLLNHMCQNVGCTAIDQQVPREEKKKLEEPIIQAMRTLRTAFKWRIMEYIWCTKPELMEGACDIDMNGCDVWPLDKDGNCDPNKTIEIPI